MLELTDQEQLTLLALRTELEPLIPPAQVVLPMQHTHQDQLTHQALHMLPQLPPLLLPLLLPLDQLDLTHSLMAQALPIHPELRYHLAQPTLLEQHMSQDQHTHRELHTQQAHHCLLPPPLQLLLPLLPPA